eukprot:m.182006 g.182006  ORF g.182006 m.182006 type:complete len:58 (+) comp15521_c0_seq3:82-255(+)
MTKFSKFVAEVHSEYTLKHHFPIGVMWDFPDDENINRISSAIYEKGALVSFVFLLGF